MELRDGLETMHDSHMTDELDEMHARIRLGVTLAFLALAFVGVIFAQWIISLEGRMG